MLLKAYSDISRGLAMYPIWWGLAWLEIKLRYSRSVIGPFWITLSMGIMICAMGPLYGALFGQNVSSYIRHLAISLIIWSFISSCINEAGGVFVGAESYIKQVSLPLSIYVFKLITKNLLMLAHNAVVGVFVLVFIPPDHFEAILLAPIGLLLVVANMFWFTLLVGMFSTRFRDVPQLIINIVQVMFFMSPIMWTVDMLSPSMRLLADFNPIYHLIEVVRAPLLGAEIHILNWAFSIALLLFGSLLTFISFVRYRARVAYWL